MFWDVLAKLVFEHFWRKLPSGCYFNTEGGFTELRGLYCLSLFFLYIFLYFFFLGSLTGQIK